MYAAGLRTRTSPVRATFFTHASCFRYPGRWLAKSASFLSSITLRHRSIHSFQTKRVLTNSLHSFSFTRRLTGEPATAPESERCLVLSRKEVNCWLRRHDL